MRSRKKRQVTAAKPSVHSGLASSSCVPTAHASQPAYLNRGGGRGSSVSQWLQCCCGHAWSAVWCVSAAQVPAPGTTAPSRLLPRVSHAGVGAASHQAVLGLLGRGDHVREAAGCDDLCEDQWGGSGAHAGRIQLCFACRVEAAVLGAAGCPRACAGTLMCSVGALEDLSPGAGRAGPRKQQWALTLAYACSARAVLVQQLAYGSAPRFRHALAAAAAAPWLSFAAALRRQLLRCPAPGLSVALSL